MIQKVKILSVVLAVAMAAGAIAASAALAVSHHFNAKVGDHITVVGLSSFNFEHTTGENLYNGCEKTTMKGEVGEATQTSFTVTPEWSGCETIKEGSPIGSMKWLLNECRYKFTGVTTAGNPTGGEHASIHLECPVGKSIETRISALLIKCASIGSQEIQDAVRYENESTHVKAIVTAHGIISTTQPACGEGVHTNGRLTTELEVTTPNGISISTT